MSTPQECLFLKTDGEKGKIQKIKGNDTFYFNLFMIDTSVEIKPYKIGESYNLSPYCETKDFYCFDLGYATGLLSKQDWISSAENLWIEATAIKENPIEGIVYFSTKPNRISESKLNLEEDIKQGKIEFVKIIEVNDGGLVAKLNKPELEGVKVFIPTSQLSPEHFPRVEKNQKISSVLEKFIGETFKVKLLKTLKDNSISASEKEAKDFEGIFQDLLKKVRKQELVSVKVTGIKDVGIFLNSINGDFYGLLHKSQIILSENSSIETLFKIGQIIQVYIYRVDREKKQIGFTMLKRDFNNSTT